MIGNLDKYTKPHHFWFEGGRWCCTKNNFLTSINPTLFNSHANVYMAVGLTMREAWSNLKTWNRLNGG